MRSYDRCSRGADTDALLAQSATDRLTSGALHLIIDGPLYRQRQCVGLDTKAGLRDAR